MKAYSYIPANSTGSFIEGVYPRQPHRVTSGLFFIFYKTCTLHKTYKHNPKVNPFGIALLIKIKRHIQLGDAGTIDHFGLAFQKTRLKQIFKKKGKQTACRASFFLGGGGGYTLLSHWELLPWEIRVAFPQAKPAATESRYPSLINYKVHAGVFSVFP